jgi:hypothetical protein
MAPEFHFSDLYSYFVAVIYVSPSLILFILVNSESSFNSLFLIQYNIHTYLYFCLFLMPF